MTRAAKHRQQITGAPGLPTPLAPEQQAEVGIGHNRGPPLDRGPPPLARLAYSPNEAAIASGRSRSRIYKALKDGELAAKKDGRATLILANELQRWVTAMPADGRTSKKEVRAHA